jgi:PAS domain S-box-containing protein
MKKMETALDASEKLLAQILDNAAEAIISIDESQHITMFNQGAEQIYGYSAKEIVGKPLDVLLPERFIEAHRQHVRNFAAAPEKARRVAEGVQIFGRRKDGSEFPAEASISKIKLAAGTIFTVILWDVTERKKAEADLERSREELRILAARQQQVREEESTMPGLGGIEVLDILRKDQPKLPILILSAHPENQYAVRALRAGAAGYMTKETAPQELIRGLRRILQGGKYVSEALAERLAIDVSGKSDRKPHDLLSHREYEIMRMIASGKPLGKIASELALSPRTVSTYRSRVLEKMQMKTNAELIRYALENKLID